MKYLIMECHMAYAVVLDEDGRFLKAANMNYEVGQTVDTIMEIVEPVAAFSEADCQSDPVYDTVFEEAVEVQPATRRASRLSRWLKPALPAAAALCLLLSGGHYFIMSPYGTVRLSINPEVELSVNRLDYVLLLSGINRDGEDLIRGYDYKRKKVEKAAADLAERAIDMDYLAPGGTIYVGVSSAHEDWADEMKKNLTWELDDRLGSDIHISATPKPEKEPESETADPAAPLVSETVPAAAQTAPAAYQTVPAAHPNDNWNEDSDEQQDEDWDDTTSHGSDDDWDDDWDDGADNDRNDDDGDADDSDDDSDDDNND